MLGDYFLYSVYLFIQTGGVGGAHFKSKLLEIGR